MSRSNSVSSQHHNNNNNNVNTSSISSGQTTAATMLIHLGNYIISVPKDYAPQITEENSSPVKRAGHKKNPSNQGLKDRSRSPAVPLPTAEMNQGGQSAIKFELNWIKFVKDAEDDYNRRLSRNDKPQQLSIFEVNQDLFELYLLKVSGRALSKIQYLNLDLKSSLCADMKLFDNQSGQMPPESVILADQYEELELRRYRRQLRRDRRRRQTAHFVTQYHETEEALQEEEQKFDTSKDPNAELTHQFSIVDAQSPQVPSIMEEGPPLKIVLEPMEEVQAASPEVKNEFQQKEEIIKEPIQQQLQQEDLVPDQQQQVESTATPPKPKKKKVLLDSLNDRSDDEDEDGAERSSPGSAIPETEDEFDRDDMAQTVENVQPTQILNKNSLETVEINATLTGNFQTVETPEMLSPDLRTPENNNTINYEQQQHDAAYPDHHNASIFAGNKLEISIDDQSQEMPSLPLEQVKNASLQKIKIGEMTIDDPYISLNEEDVMKQLDIKSQGESLHNNGEIMLSQHTGEHYTMNEVTDPMLDSSNPFREKSVISSNSPHHSQAKIVSNEEEGNKAIHQVAGEQDFINYQQEPQIQDSLPQVQDSISIHAAFEEEHKQESSIHIVDKSHGSTHTAHRIQQMNSQQSLEVVEKTNSHNDIHHHINYEKGEQPVNFNDQSISAITSGRKNNGNLSALNTVRAQEEEQPEREVILRFEVGVGKNPLNLTFDEASAIYEQQNLKGDAALGVSTPLDRTITQNAKIDAAIGTSQKEQFHQQDASIMMTQKSANDIALSAHITSDNSRVQIKSQTNQREDSPQPKSLNASIDQKPRQLTPSRLEVTLTAEPDKPIMVEVRGSEKQFLISALTKHIFDILSQPNRLQIYQDENGSVKFGDSDDPNAPGQHLEPVIDSTGKGAFKLGTQNINLKLKGVIKDQEPYLQQLQNLGGKNLQNQMNKRQEQFLMTFYQQYICTERQQLNKNQKNINQQLDDLNQKVEQPSNAKVGSKSQQLNEQPIHAVYSSIDGRLSMINEPMDNRYSLPEATASARDNSAFIKIIPAAHNNGRPSILSENIMPLTPHSVQERQPSPPHFQQPKEGIVSVLKRTTIVANTEGKINEEQSQGSFEEDIPKKEGIQEQEIASQKLPIQDRNSTEGSFRKINSGQNQMIMKNRQDLLRSRPETANFNRAYAAVAADNINPFIQQEEEEGAQVNSPQLETPKGHHEEDVDISIADQKSRLETPHADLLEGTPYNNLQNSVPAEMEDYIKQPLHPTIPEQHPNGYFSNESDYMMVLPLEGTSLGNGASSHSNDQYLTPKLAYYDQFPSSAGQIPVINLPTAQQVQHQLIRHQSINDFYSSQYGYSDADQNAEDFILAEGYPLLNFVKDGGRNSLNSLKTEIQSNQSKGQHLKVNRTIKAQNLYDFNGHSYSHQNTTNASLETPPHAYRIRKVILPNYPNVTNISQQSDLDIQKQSPSSQQLRPLLNNTLQPNNLNAGALLRKQKTLQSSLKQLPVVKTKKRIFNNTINNTTIYSVNGGPAQRSIPLSQSHCQTRSLSPLRKKNHIFYTSNFIMSQKKILEQLQLMNAQTLASTQNNGSTNNTMGHLTVDDFAQFGYYSQSPQPRLRNSPYLSDDEYKILHDYYDIQCEPTGMQRGGVPLMKVKRVQRPKNRTFNIFNFPDDPTTNVQLPKALTSLQIFYPQFQPSQAEYMARTLATPSKWFDRFNQSTRNLNHTLNNLHNQHSRTDANESRTSNAMKNRSCSHNSLLQKRNLQAKERSAALIERNRIQVGNSNSPESIKNNTSHNLSRSGGVLMNNKMKSHKKLNYLSSGKESGGTNSSTTFMPPLHKIYTASLGQGGYNHLHHSLNNHDSSQEKSRTSKKNGAQNGKTLPPRPGNNNKKSVFGSKIGVNIIRGESPKMLKTTYDGTGDNMSKNMLVTSGGNQSPNIINTNHNQYVCFGVNIITKSDK